MALPLHQKIAANFSGALVFGLYLATLLVCVRWLFFADEGWKLRKNIRWTLVTITFLIFVCNIMYLALELQETMEKAWRTIMGFEDRPYTATGWRSIIICTMANANILLNDSVLIYRCWVIYGKRLSIIMFPSFFWLSALVCTILQIFLQTVHIHNDHFGPYEWASVYMDFGPGIVLLPFWLSTVVLNAYSTAALIRRVYKAAEGCKQYTPVKHLHLAIRIIAESGLLSLSINLAHTLAWFGKEEFPVSIIAALNVPIVGIAFNWFLIRFEESKADNAVAESHTPELSTMQFQGKSTVLTRGYPLEREVVAVSKPDDDARLTLSRLSSITSLSATHTDTV